MCRAKIAVASQVSIWTVQSPKSPRIALYYANRMAHDMYIQSDSLLYPYSFGET